MLPNFKTIGNALIVNSAKYVPLQRKKLSWCIVMFVIKLSIHIVLDLNLKVFLIVNGNALSVLNANNVELKNFSVKKI